jgi:hypothetical protein
MSCQFVLTRGIRKGEICGKTAKIGGQFCSTHSKKNNPTSSSGEAGPSTQPIPKPVEIINTNSNIITIKLSKEDIMALVYMLNVINILNTIKIQSDFVKTRTFNIDELNE